MCKGSVIVLVFFNICAKVYSTLEMGLLYQSERLLRLLRLLIKSQMDKSDDSCKIAKSRS